MSAASMSPAGALRENAPHAPAGLRRAVATVLGAILLMSSGCEPDRMEPPPAASGGVATVVVSERPGTVGPDGLDDSQRRGRAIYFSGASPGGAPITAMVGSSRDGVPASILTCVNCHGRDGRGRPEGGLDPPNVTWTTLSRAQAADSRRARPAYTPSLLGRLITMGIDAGGARLGIGMPRYQLAPRDLADLVAYLQVLGNESDPGVSPERIRLGALLPTESAAPGLRSAMARTLDAFARDVNDRGGVYRRAVEIVYDDLAASSGDAGARVARFLDDCRVFALVTPYVAGREASIFRAAREAGVPVVGLVGDDDEEGLSADRHVFRTRPGLVSQAHALAAFAARPPGLLAPAIVGEGHPASIRAADAVAGAWTRAGLASPERAVLDASTDDHDLDLLTRRLATRGSDGVVYLGPAGLLRPLIDAAGRASWHPRLFVPISLGEGVLSDLPPAFDGRIVLAFPYLPGDVTSAGQALLTRLGEAHDLPRGHQATQLALLTALKVVEEGLRRAGRDLSRGRLIEELESLEAFETGLSRPLTFGPNRHLGVSGSYLMTIRDGGRRLDPEGWIEVGTSP